jgi:hypothetical protein
MENNQSVNTERNTSEIPSTEKVKADAIEVVDKAKSIGREQLESGKDTAAGQAEKVANVIQQAASQLKETNLRSLADYTSEIGTTIKSFSDRLQNRSVDELVTDIRDMARRNPTAFVLGSVVIGIGISRFFKASAERRHEGSNDVDSGNRVFENERAYVEEWRR